MPPSTDKQERDERNERGKAVELAVGQIEKQFGKGSIMRLGQKGPIQMIESIPTGSISIDYALVSAGCRGGASSRSSDPSRPARRRWRCR
jgi:RecA/RadA recombinase